MKSPHLPTLYEHVGFSVMSLFSLYVKSLTIFFSLQRETVEIFSLTHSQKIVGIKISKTNFIKLSVYEEVLDTSASLEIIHGTNSNYSGALAFAVVPFQKFQ